MTEERDEVLPPEMKEKLEKLRRNYIRKPDGKGGYVIEEAELLVWAEWFEDSFEDRLIKRTDFPDGSHLSTIFLGIDHNWGFDDPRPILWETMFFKKLDEPKMLDFFGSKREMTHDGIYEWRWHSEEDAAKAHAFISSRLVDDINADLSEYDPLEIKTR